jgi:hypothetical protein
LAPGRRTRERPDPPIHEFARILLVLNVLDRLNLGMVLSGNSNLGDRRDDPALQVG